VEIFGAGVWGTWGVSWDVDDISGGSRYLQ